MKAEDLIVFSKKVRKYTSYKGEISPAVDNIIARDFHANKPNEKWLTDITEFAIPAGKVYLSPIIDCFDGMVVSWNTGTTPNSILVNNMLDEAVKNLKPNEHPIVHSDRGCHYRWPGWISICERNGLVRSMSAKGCSPDNAAMEGFFGLLKKEFFHGRDWSGWSPGEFIEALGAWIGRFNSERASDALGGATPDDYRSSLGMAAI